MIAGRYRYSSTAFADLSSSIARVYAYQPTRNKGCCGTWNSNDEIEPPGRSARWNVAKTSRHSWSARKWCRTAAAS
jgi:hypothetical protein